MACIPCAMVAAPAIGGAFPVLAGIMIALTSFGKQNSNAIFVLGLSCAAMGIFNLSLPSASTSANASLTNTFVAIILFIALLFLSKH